MKIIFIADIHLGLSGKLNDTIWALNKIDSYAQKNNIDNIIILGDLFHDRINLNIEVLATAHNFFSSSKSSWIAFPGNHDMFLRNSWKFNSIRPFDSSIQIIDDVSYLDIEGVNYKFWIIPFITNEQGYVNVLNKINNQVNEKDILLTHIGVVGATYNACFLTKNWNIINFENTKFKKVYAGHFHCYQTVGKTTYAGSPIPYRFDEGLVSHGFLVYNTATYKHEFVLIFEDNENHPPDYVTLMDDTKFETLNFTDDNVRIVLTKQYTSDELTQMRNKIINLGAKKVSWIRHEKEDETAITHQIGISLKDPNKLMKEWLKKDNPELDHRDLLSLNKEVIKMAEDKGLED